MSAPAKRSVQEIARDWSELFNALPENVRTIGLAMELKTRIQQLNMEKERLLAAYTMALRKVEEHCGTCERALDELGRAEK